jgi:hypothetical protein
MQVSVKMICWSGSDDLSYKIFYLMFGQKNNLAMNAMCFSGTHMSMMGRTCMHVEALSAVSQDCKDRVEKGQLFLCPALPLMCREGG